MRTIIILTLLILSLSACRKEKSAPVKPAPTPTVTVSFAEASVQEGQILYSVACVACHGPDAAGIPGLGSSLRDSEFVRSRSDADLLAFIIQGRPIDHPDNTSGVAMPPRAGMPNLQDNQIASIIAYIRTLKGQS